MHSCGCFRLFFPIRSVDRNDLVVQVTTCQFLQVMCSFAGVQEIIRHHAVAGHALDVDALAAQNEQVVLDVLVDLGHGGVFQDRPQPGESDGGIEHSRSRRTAGFNPTAFTTQRQIPCLSFFPCKMPGQQSPPTTATGSSFPGPWRNAAACQLGEKRLEQLRRIDQPIIRLPLGIAHVGQDRLGHRPGSDRDRAIEDRGSMGPF